MILLIVIALLLFSILAVLIPIGLNIGWYVGILKDAVEKAEYLEGLYTTSDQGNA